MKKVSSISASVTAVATAAALAAGMLPSMSWAHHSFAAEFDRTKPVTLEGVVAELEWTNPHTRLYILVKDATGEPVRWELELAGPNGLLRAGWTRHSVQIGDKVTVKGFLAKDGSHLANAASIVTADGKTILSESTVASDAKPQ